VAHTGFLTTARWIGRAATLTAPQRPQVAVVEADDVSPD
jgi:hypothetical protein